MQTHRWSNEQALTGDLKQHLVLYGATMHTLAAHNRQVRIVTELLHQLDRLHLQVRAIAETVSDAAWAGQHQAPPVAAPPVRRSGPPAVPATNTPSGSHSLSSTR